MKKSSNKNKSDAQNLTEEDKIRLENKKLTRRDSAYDSAKEKAKTLKKASQQFIKTSSESAKQVQEVAGKTAKNIGYIAKKAGGEAKKFAEKKYEEHKAKTKSASQDAATEGKIEEKRQVLNLEDLSEKEKYFLQSYDVLKVTPTRDEVINDINKIIAKYNDDLAFIKAVAKERRERNFKETVAEEFRVPLIEGVETDKIDELIARDDFEFNQYAKQLFALVIVNLRVLISENAAKTDDNSEEWYNQTPFQTKTENSSVKTKEGSDSDDEYRPKVPPIPVFVKQSNERKNIKSIRESVNFRNSKAYNAAIQQALENNPRMSDNFAGLVFGEAPRNSINTNQKELDEITKMFGGGQRNSGGYDRHGSSGGSSSRKN